MSCFKSAGLGDRSSGVRLFACTPKRPQLLRFSVQNRADVAVSGSGQDLPPVGTQTNGEGAEPILELYDLSYWLPPLKR